MPENEKMEDDSERKTDEGQVGIGVGSPVFKEVCFALRGNLEILKEQTMLLSGHPEFKNEQTSQNQHSEMKANVKLAYRHLEDARMRLGKAVQAYDGGTSCYPR